MDQLVKSIQIQGVLDPIIVRESKDGGYEIISGHRRTHAAERAGLRVIKARIVRLSDAEAKLLRMMEGILRAFIQSCYTG